MTATLEEVRPVPLTPAQRRERRAALEVERERRFQRRQVLLDADPHIDPRRRELYLDRRLVNGIAAAKLLGLKSPTRLYGDGYLPLDAITEDGKCVEVGRIREHFERFHHYTLDLGTGDMRMGRIRHGRTRHHRTNRSKRNPPGTGRTYVRRDPESE